MKRSLKSAGLLLCLFAVGILLGFVFGRGRSSDSGNPVPAILESISETSGEELPPVPEDAAEEIPPEEQDVPDAGAVQELDPAGEGIPEESIPEESTPDQADSDEPPSAGAIEELSPAGDGLPDGEPAVTEAPLAGAVEEFTPAGEGRPEKGQSYYAAEDVAAYIHLYGKLPPNYISKDKAESLGWSAREGNLWDVADGAVIGGSRFGNYEGLLPKKKGRKYYECDVNYYGGFRGGDRLVYSSDGLIYYTEDHYETFTLLYGDGS